MFFDETKAGKDPLFRQKWAGIFKMFVWTPCYTLIASHSLNRLLNPSNLSEITNYIPIRKFFRSHDWYSKMKKTPS